MFSASIVNPHIGFSCARSVCRGDTFITQVPGNSKQNIKRRAKRISRHTAMIFAPLEFPFYIGPQKIEN